MSNFTFRQTPSIITLFQCCVLSLLYNHWTLQRGDASVIMVKLDKKTIFREMITAVYVQRITKVIVSQMKIYSPHTFSTSHVKKLLFDYACFNAIKDIEVAHKRYLSFPSLNYHSLHISAQNQAKFTHCMLRKILSLQNAKLNLFFPKTSGIQQKICLSILLFSCCYSFIVFSSTVLIFGSKGELLAQTVSKNFNPNDIGQIPHAQMFSIIQSIVFSNLAQICTL